jgi:hypothetical protein
MAVSGTTARNSLIGCRVTMILMMPTGFERLGEEPGVAAGLGR